MSKSAFGVEHSDVSKAYAPPTRMASRMQGIRQQTGKLPPKPQTATQPPKPGGKHKGPGQLRQLGNTMQQNPIKTTGAVLGGGGLALTGGVYANRKKPGA